MPFGCSFGWSKPILNFSGSSFDAVDWLLAIEENLIEWEKEKQ